MSAIGQVDLGVSRSILMTVNPDELTIEGKLLLANAWTYVGWAALQGPELSREALDRVHDHVEMAVERIKTKIKQEN